MYRNRFTGPLPFEWKRLSKLKALGLDANFRLSGTLPSWLGQMTAMTKLTLSQNCLNGTLPTQLGQLTRLEFCLLSENSLSGSLPTEIGRLTNLSFIQALENSDWNHPF